MNNKTLVNFTPQDALGRGIDVIANAVSSTLGPRGQNVALTKLTPRGDIYERLVVHDGVTVARAIELSDETENMGAQLLKQAAQKQVDEVGDGTTAVMLLAQAIYKSCQKQIATGTNPMSLRKDIESDLLKLTTELEGMKVDITEHRQLEQIAISSSEDEQLGVLVAKTLEKIGSDGVVSVEESKGAETVVEHQQGMQIDKGYAHQLFVTNPDRMEAVLEHVKILVTDKPITTLVDLEPLLTAVAKKDHKLVLLSPEIGGEALPLLIQNKLEGKLFSLAIKAPSFGNNQKEILQDICALTGASYITEDAGHSFEDVTYEDLGMCESVTSTATSTILVGSQEESAAVKERIAALRASIEETDDDFQLTKLHERLAKLTSGVSVIKVGGATEVEMKERRERALDAVCACTAARENGIISGGEVSYLRARKAILPTSILYAVCSVPFQKLLSNAGLNAGEYTEKLAGKPPQFGVDVTDGRVKDMTRSGIIDPVSVPIHALKNAVSVAVQLMTTGVVIVPEQRDEQ